MSAPVTKRATKAGRRCPNECGPPMVRFQPLPDPRWFWLCERCGRMDEIKPATRRTGKSKPASHKGAVTTARTPLVGRPGHNKGASPDADLLTNEEVVQLMQATNRGATGARNRALIAVMHRSGLRVSEALALKPSDVFPVKDEGGKVRVLHGKGNKARTVALDPGGLAIVEAWKQQRAKLGIRTRYLFCSLNGRQMSPQAVREMLKRVAAKAGIEKRVHPHGLRHAYAAHLSQSRVPVRSIQGQLGHANLNVTSRYLDRISPDVDIDAVRGVSWD